MEKIISIVCHQVIRNRKGDVIGYREVVNEIQDDGINVESITRALLKMEDGRILADQIIKRDRSPAFLKNYEVNLLTGRVS